MHCSRGTQTQATVRPPAAQISRLAGTWRARSQPPHSPATAQGSGAIRIVAETVVGTGWIGAVSSIQGTPAFDASGGIAWQRSTNSLLLLGASTRRLQKLEVGSWIRSDVAFDGTPGVGNGALPSATTTAPSFLAYDASANVCFFAENSTYIRAIDFQNNLVTDVAGSALSGNVDGSGSLARFSDIAGLTLLHDGSAVFVSMKSHHIIKRVDLSLNRTNVIVSTLFGDGLPGTNDGFGTNCRYNSYGHVHQGNATPPANTAYSDVGAQV